jgi:hypothetical protein
MLSQGKCWLELWNPECPGLCDEVLHGWSFRKGLFLWMVCCRWECCSLVVDILAVWGSGLCCRFFGALSPPRDDKDWYKILSPQYSHQVWAVKSDGISCPYWPEWGLSLQVIDLTIPQCGAWWGTLSSHFRSQCSEQWGLWGWVLLGIGKLNPVHSR